MFMVKISPAKIDDLSQAIGKGLRYLGHAMECIEEMQQMGGMDERRGAQYRDDAEYRYPMSERMSMRDYDDYDDMPMGERRGVRGTGRYSRYR